MTEHPDIESILGEITSDDSDLMAPPDDLWARIENEVATSAAPAPTADVITLDSRRRRPVPVLLGAAAAAVILIGGLVLVNRPDDSGPSLVASAELTYDPETFDELGADATAEVALVDDDGTLRIDVERSALPAPAGEDADLELWLIEPDADGNPVALVSLGTVDPDRPGDFVVPADVDTTVFNVVDISVEPRDGDAAHSGRSILRGALNV